jgi:hypothetical protein
MRSYIGFGVERLHRIPSTVFPRDTGWDIDGIVPFVFPILENHNQILFHISIGSSSVTAHIAERRGDGGHRNVETTMRY